MNKNKLCLSIDTAIDLGSFSLWENKCEIKSKIGDLKTSRSEDILVIIEKMLGETMYNLKNIDEILYTLGPGSYTGLRVGIASMQGLALGLNAGLYAVSVFEAFATLGVEYETCVSAIYIRKDKFLFQEFVKNKDKVSKSKIYSKTVRSFWEDLKYKKETCVVVDSRGFEEIRSLNSKKIKQLPKIICASDNASVYAYNYFLSKNRKVKQDYMPIYGREFG